MKSVLRKISTIIIMLWYYSAQLRISPSIWLQIRGVHSLSFTSYRHRLQGCYTSRVKDGIKSISNFNPYHSTLSYGRRTGRLASSQSQEEYKTQMASWKGSSKSSSKFVTHFIAGNNTEDMTVEDAILSVLPNKNITSQKRLVRSNAGDQSASDYLPLHEFTERLIDVENDPLLRYIEPQFRHNPKAFPIQIDGDDQERPQLSPAELLALGSIWFLPASAPRDPSLGIKTERLQLKDLKKVLEEGDYLRVHHSPRRFPTLYAYDWGKGVAEYQVNRNSKVKVEEQGSDLAGVIVAEDKEKGYIICNKPAGIPVHPTVDNVSENVAGAIGRFLLDRDRQVYEEAVQQMQIERERSDSLNRPSRKQKDQQLLYVVPPQRLDRDTSGLFVVATKKLFSAYFAKQLREKTKAQLLVSPPDDSISKAPTLSTVEQSNILKRYRCLVCISPDSTLASSDQPTSMSDEISRLQAFAKSKSIIRHYLEVSIKTPRTFASQPQANNATWLECLMRITDVGDICTVIGNEASTNLQKSLFSKDEKPKDCVAVANIEVELLTGRTHQIRGQLSQLGFPLCGDVMYGGAVNTTASKYEDQDMTKPEGFVGSASLALQCCELEFLDPDHTINKKKKEKYIQSDRWNKFRLETAWWTELLDKYKTHTSDDATTSSKDLDIVKQIKEGSIHNTQEQGSNSILKLPPKVQLSPGRHKYIYVRARKPGSDVDWYVKSASIDECGEYHADVARDLVKDLSDAGFKTTVMGGGRIDFNKAKQAAHVYGFSYGFGKGDHEFVSYLIEEAGYVATFDDSDNLY